jgi:uncharacterized membrane protein YjjB (DUF3815 family)
MKKIITILMPERNIICGYAAGLICAVVVHFLVAANVQLDPTQSAALGAATTGFISHLFDSIVKTQS